MRELIDRKSLIEALRKDIQEYKDTDGQSIPFKTGMIYRQIEAIKIIEEQPTVESPTWIPCSEQLPKSEDKYGYVKCNVTVIRSHYPTSSYDICDEPYDEYFVADAMYDVSQKIWHLGEHTQLNALIDIEDLPLNCDYVIAWMPLPEPYKGE